MGLGQEEEDEETTEGNCLRRNCMSSGPKADLKEVLGEIMAVAVAG